MATIVLFHSVYGLRPAVLTTAERLRSAGHVVVTPDLYAGSMAASVDEGFALSRRVGWETIVQRARTTLQDLPADTVLAGLSMGVGVVYALLSERSDAAGLLLLHGIGRQSAALRAGLPVQLHVAEPDELFPPAEVSAWRAEMMRAGATVRVYTYPGAGHLFTDPDTPDHDQQASELAWQRSLDFLGSL